MYKTIITVCLFYLSALLVSCGGNGTTDSQGNNPADWPAGKTSDHVFELDFGETAIIESENLEVTFESIVQDSRCPSDVICVWQGEGIIKLRVVALPADTHYVTASLSGGCQGGCGSYSPAFDTLDYRFRLLSLEPYPVSTVETPDEDYTATIAVFPFPPLDSVAGAVIISDTHPAVIQDALFVLDSVRIAGDVITLTIEYGGGCNEHEFELHMSPSAFMESMPVQANLFLRHVDFDDPCRAWFRRSISFDLRPVAQQYEISYGGIDCIVPNVYHFMNGSDPVEKVRVLYHPEGAPPASWCSPREL